jgi:murein DD-endopeptidase MepM/ murein hydrolase activator NlpD
MQQHKRMRILAALAVPILLLGGAAERAAASQQSASARRGMVFLAGEVGGSTSPAEIVDFVASCRIDFVVFDFAWITGTWGRAKWDALRETCAELKKKDVQVAFMYRPRALSRDDARVHFARDRDGKVGDSHLHLCFAHADSQAWAAQWGSRILKEIPALDTLIIYNLLSVCQCPDCRDGKGAAFAEKFLNRCRTDWSRVRPGVQVGHVGVGDEYVDVVDFFCPFVGVNHERGQEQTPLEFPQGRLEQFRTAHPKQWMAPLLKVCWVEATHNSTRDIVQTVQDCERNKTGFLLWYYEWILHSKDRPYDPQAIVEALGGDWGRLGKHYPQKPVKEGTQPQVPAAVDLPKLLAQFRANADDNFADVVAAGEAAVEGVVAIMKDETAPYRSRYIAANALGAIKSPKAVKPLLEALKDRDFNVRRCAADALGRFGDPSAVPALQRLARSDPYFYQDPKTRKSQYLVRDAARKALRVLRQGATVAAQVGLHKDREILLEDASKPPPFRTSLRIRRLPWPFPGDMKDMSIWNNYQQSTDTYVHGGLDFMQPMGTECRAVDDGYVAVISTNYPKVKTHYFFIVASEQGGNEGWCYVHLDKDTYTFKEGDRIRQGQVLAKVVDFSKQQNGQGNHHLHLHYVRFKKTDDGKVEVESLIDPAAFFDWKDSAPPQIVDPLRFVRKGTFDEFPKDGEGNPAVSGKVEIIAGISDNAYKDHVCNWMAAVVTLEIEGASGKPWRKLVLDQRGPINEKDKFGAPALYLSYKEGEKWRNELPPSGGVHFVKVTSTDGDGVVEASDQLQSWDTAAESGGKRRFPDGLYTVTVRAWDVKRNQATRTATVRVANKNR